jgi:hypothetical protein
MVFSVGQVTVDSGHLYVAQCDNYMNTYMHSLLATTGSVVWSQPFDAQWDNYWAPLVVGGRVYFDGGEYGGLYSFDQTSGAQDWYAGEEQWDEWSPMFLDDRIYSFTEGNLRAFDPVTGTAIAVATVTWNWTGYSMRTSAVSDGTSIFVIAPPSIYAYPPSLSGPAWTASASYLGQPAVANGVLYALSMSGEASGGLLSALDAASGSVLWTFAGDGVMSYPPVVAGNYVYVASDANVYAVDTSTHEQVWTGTPGGWLSIANGQLYVAAGDGSLHAWHMTQ